MNRMHLLRGVALGAFAFTLELHDTKTGAGAGGAAHD